MTISTSVAALAAQQGGYVTRQQLLDRGMSESSINRRLDSNQWGRPVDGVFKLFEVPGADSLLRGAILALPDAVVSHESAARLLGFGPVPGAVASVCVHASTTHSFPGVVVRRCRDIAEHHRTVVSGLPVTSISRTVFDLGGVVRPALLDRIVENLVIEQRMSLDDLAEVLSEVGRRGKRGTATVREVLEARGSGSLASGTRLERLGTRILREAGLPEPEVQYSPAWEPRISFDLAYPESQLAIEWDSRRWHSTLERFESDRRRDRSAALHGWQVLRYTWEDLTRRPKLVEAEVRMILGLRADLAS